MVPLVMSSLEAELNVAPAPTVQFPVITLSGLERTIVPLVKFIVPEEVTLPEMLDVASELNVSVAPESIVTAEVQFRLPVAPPLPNWSVPPETVRPFPRVHVPVMIWVPVPVLFRPM